MQSIGTYQILGLLLYLSIFIGRYQFWANRSIDNIDQRIPASPTSSFSATQLTKYLTKVLGILVEIAYIDM